MLAELKKQLRPSLGKVKRRIQGRFIHSPFQKKIIETVLRESQNHYQDNFDNFRFKPEEENAYDLNLHTYLFSYYMNNASKFEDGYKMLADQASKELYLKLIAYRILGHKCVQLPNDSKAYWEHRKKAKDMESEIAEIDLKGGFTDFKRYSLDYNNQKIIIEGQHSNIAWPFFIKQYHFERDGIVIQPELNDHVIDAGACYGDTAISFASHVGHKGKIYSFDFLPPHIKAMQNNIDLNPWTKDIIKLLPYALGQKSNTVSVYTDDSKQMKSGASLLNTEGISSDNVPVRSIDDMHEAGEITRVDFIKMDIEGFEVPALQGAENVIKRYKPKLAISLYHKQDDFYNIPKLIRKINPKYSFYLDHYTSYGEETVLYAIDQS